MKPCTSWIGLLTACIIGLSSAAAAAPPAAPPDAYKNEAEYTQKSPDGAISIEQYVNKGDWTWQFWMRRNGGFTLLDTDPGYAADFTFIYDQNWTSATRRSAQAPPRCISTISRRRAMCARTRSRSANWRGTT